MSSCAACGNDNHETILDHIDYTPVEATTICFGCGWSDYWSYGHYFGDTTSELFDHKLMRRMQWTQNSTKESGIDLGMRIIKGFVKNIVTSLRLLKDNSITNWFIR